MKQEKTNIIIWERYVSPYANRVEVEFPGYEGYKPPDDTKMPYEDGDVRIVDMDEMMEEVVEKRGTQKRMLFTPWGVLQLSDFNDLSVLFNFWIGHTNFNLSEEKIGIINSIEGVEELRPITRYRFRMAVGKAFCPSEVKVRIQEKLNCKTKNVPRTSTARY